MNSPSILLAYIHSSQDFDVDLMPAEKLTHICYAFAQVTETGISVGDAGEVLDKAELTRREAMFGQLKQLKKRNPTLKVLISLGGWTGDGFSDAALTAESRASFAESATQFMRDRQLDGIDLDWEYPTNDMASITARPEDKQNFSYMLAALRQNLDALSDAERRTGKERYLLTIAAGAAQYYLDGVELEKVASYCDFINLMTYDFYNGWATSAGHHANLYNSESDPDGDSADNGVRLFLANGVPANKLVLGCPFYGRSLKGVDQPGLGAPGIPKSNSMHSFHQIRTELLPGGRYVRHWDEAAQAPWLYDGEQFISYEDTESIALKADYIKQHGLAGAMFWEYSLDQENVLLNVLWQGLQTRPMLR